MIKDKLWHYFEKDKKYVIIASLLVIIETAMELIIPFVMTQIIDVGVKQQDLQFILNRGGIMVLLSALSLVFGLAYARYAALGGQGLGRNMRTRMYEKIQKFSFTNMDHFSESSLVTRLTSDIVIIQRSVTQGIRPLIRGPVMVTMAFILTFKLNYRIALIFLVSAPILGIAIYLIIRKTAPWYRRTQRVLDQINLKVQETLVAIRVVKSYVRGEYEKEAFSQITTTYEDTSKMAFHYAVMNAPMLQLAMYGTTIAILWIGGNLVPESLKIGELIGCLSYVLQILNGLMIFSFVFTMLMRAIASIERVEEVIDEKIDMEDSGDARLSILKGEITFDNVCFKYSKDALEDVLSHVSFTIPSGSTLGIVGGTGSAKSSLVQLIPRLYDVTSGDIFIDNHSVKEYSLSNLRDQVGIVLQKNLLFSGTIGDNLRWGDKNASDEDLDRVCRIACIDDFIEKLPSGYETELGQAGVNLSGGQKQRLCIARTLLKQPRIIIFDDSTSAVDTATESRIRAGIDEELPEVTKIIISQRISSVSHAQQILVLKDGIVDALDTHDRLLQTNEIYRDMFETQKRGAII